MNAKTKKTTGPDKQTLLTLYRSEDASITERRYAAAELKKLGVRVDTKPLDDYARNEELLDRKMGIISPKVAGVHHVGATMVLGPLSREEARAAARR